MANAEWLQRVHHRVDDRRRRSNSGGLANTLCPDWMMRRWGDRMASLPVGRLHRGWDEVIHEGTAETVAILIERNHFHQRHANTVGEATMDLAFDDQRVDLCATVIDRNEAADFNLGGTRVNVDDADVCTEGIGQVVGVVTDLSVEAALDALWQVASTVRSHRNVLDRHRLRRIALHGEGTLLPFEVGHGYFEHSRGNDLSFVDDLAGDQRSCSTGHRRRTGTVGSESEWGVVGVAMNNVDVLWRNASLLGDDLGEGRLVALTLRLNREPNHGLTGWVDAKFATIGHTETQDVHVLTRTCTHSFGKERDANAHQLATFALFGLLLAEFVVAGHLHSLAHCWLVVARVIDPTGLRFIRELIGLNEVLESEFGRVHVEFICQTIDEALDHVDRFGDAERTRIRNATGRLVGVDGLHVGVRSLQVITSGEHTKEAGWILNRCGHAIECAVVGKHMATNRENRAVACRADLAVHDVVTGKAGRN